MDSRFKVGKKVMSVTLGRGEVKEVDSYVRVKYEHIKDHVLYTLDGKYCGNDMYPDIYLDGDIHPLLGVPVRLPKEKVKKEIAMYANVYYNEWEGEYSAAVYSDKKNAEEHARCNTIAKAVPIKIEFETEEIV